MSTLTKSPQAQEADTLRASFDNQLERIRADRDLSDEGKLTRIKALYADVTERLTKLQAEETTAHDAKVESLRRSLFGISSYWSTSDPNTAISYRDAQDRAASLPNQDAALDRLEQARLSNDTILTQAIVSHAVKHQWNQVLEAWSQYNPTKAQTLRELQDLTQTNRTGDMKRLLLGGFTYTATRPAELGVNFGAW